MILILILFVFAYFFLLTHFVSGWRRLPEQKLDEANNLIFISLVVPFRNEASKLPVLLESLTQQTHKRFQLILIDDHSTDQSYQLAQSYLSRFSDVHLLSATFEGKKQALRQAIAQAKGDLIVCTDADCMPSKNWLKAIAQFQCKEPCDLILAPLQMSYGKSLFSRLQALEFTSLIASAAGSAAVKMPVLANAANMAFSPRLWSQSEASLKEKEASGDDMFLLHQAKKLALEVRFLKSKEAMLKIAPSPNLSSFFNQRKRWAGKSKSYTDSQTILVGLVVLGVSLSLILGLLYALFFPWYWKVLLLLWFLKMLVDGGLLYRVSSFFEIKPLLIYIPLLSLIYPFYALASVLGGLFGSFSWKGRRF